jgi:hypothetical protein
MIHASYTEHYFVENPPSDQGADFRRSSVDQKGRWNLVRTKSKYYHYYFLWNF